MNAWIGFVATAALATLLALATALALRGALLQLLIELCGNERRARFWSSFTSVFTVLAALCGALASLPEPSSAIWSGAPHLRMQLESFRAGVFGLLAALAVTAFALLRSIAAFDAHARRERFTREHAS